MKIPKDLPQKNMGCNPVGHIYAKEYLGATMLLSKLAASGSTIIINHSQDLSLSH